MARIFLVPPQPKASGFDHLLDDYRLLARSATESASPHRLAAKPEEATVILFVGTRDALHRDVRSHPLTRRFPERVVLYESRDWFIPFLRGIYPSIRRDRLQPRRARSGHYLRWSDQASIGFTDPETVPSRLFGFRGASVTHPIRRRVLALRHPAALLADTTEEIGRGFGQSAEVYEDYRKRYGEELASVRFVLCPRGVGASSMRIFEAMKAGRVPVVISDAWVEPDGPAWHTFALRVGERDVEQIPELLEELAPRAPAMGRLAREAWERWFSPQAAFGTLGEAAAQLVEGSWARERLDQILERRRLFEPHALRHHVVGPALRRLAGRS